MSESKTSTARKKLPPRYPAAPPPGFNTKNAAAKEEPPRRDSKSDSLNFGENSIDRRSNYKANSLPESDGPKLGLGDGHGGAAKTVDEYWSPVGGEKTEEEIYIEQVLYGPSKKKPLPVFEALRRGQFPE